MIEPAILLNLALIFMARVADVSLGTFRILQLVRGHPIAAAFIGFFEVMLYMTILGRILGGGHSLNFPELTAYCMGFASGTIVGAFLEDRFMRGYTMIEATAPCDESTLKTVDELRNKGFGTTLIRGEGKNGPRYIMKIIVNRQDIPEVTGTIRDTAFVTVFDVKSCVGGYFRMKRK